MSKLWRTGRFAKKYIQVQRCQNCGEQVDLQRSTYKGVKQYRDL